MDATASQSPIVYSPPTATTPENVRVKITQAVKLCLNDSAAIYDVKSDSLRLQIELLRIIEQVAIQQLLILSLARRKMGDESVRVATEADFEKLNRIISDGLSLAENIIGRNRSLTALDLSVAMLYKSRLLMHLSAYEMHRVRLPGMRAEKRQLRGLHLLADAESCLAYHDPRRMGTDHAMIELHRAEFRLTEAELIQCSVDNSLTFADICDKICHSPLLCNNEGMLHWHQNGEKIGRSVFGLKGTNYDKITIPSSVVDGLRKVKALVQDAMRFLRRAEEVLRARRRNVWWTSWFFQRKLAAISMSVWATVLEKETPIPYLGLEAAPRKTPTVADEVLTEALRMSRTDVYRLASILDAYISCACGLQVRLMLDRKTLRLPERRKDMKDLLQEGLSRLREMSAEQRPRLSQDSDAALCSYIASVEERAVQTIGYLNIPMV